MSKKTLLIYLLLCPVWQIKAKQRPWIEIKPSYFAFVNAPMKEIYNHGGFEIQGSGSLPFTNQLDLYVGIGYRKAWGHALITGEKTTLAVVPLDVGLRPLFKFSDNHYYYFTIGPRLFHVHQHNDSVYVDRKINDVNLGLFINTGINLLFSRGLLLGLFGEYSYEKSKSYPAISNVFIPGSVQVGGVAVGLSIGYEF